MKAGTAMRLATKIRTVLTLGTALGLLAARFTVAHGGLNRISDGPWETSLNAGRAWGDPAHRCGRSRC